METKRSQILSILWDYHQGSVNEAETLRRLDSLQIRGGFDGAGRFVGFDYEAQQWIDEPA